MQSNPPSSTESASEVKHIPTQKLSALQRFTSIIRPHKNASPPPFPPESWTIEGQDAGGTPGSDTVPEVITPDQAPVKPTKEQLSEAPEPQTLAQRIRASLVAPLGDSTTSLPNAKLDEKLKAWLSSDSVMNGTLYSGAQTVWSCLDRLNPMKTKEDKASTAGGQEATDTESDSESLMMYGPLEPDSESQVEIAKTRVEEDIHTGKTPGTAHDGAEAPGDESKGKGKGKKIWIPSLTKISLETTWWGYRIYLPPPVLEKLNTYQPIATKKAAVISTSLKWILDKVPTMMVPPPLRPSLILLKRLTPYLGSIGVFVAWSWGKIISQDKGNGVYLTATWLLPVALVPSTWDVSKFPVENSPSAAPVNDTQKATDKQKQPGLSSEGITAHQADSTPFTDEQLGKKVDG